MVRGGLWEAVGVSELTAVVTTTVRGGEEVTDRLVTEGKVEFVVVRGGETVDSSALPKKTIRTNTIPQYQSLQR